MKRIILVALTAGLGLMSCGADDCGTSDSEVRDKEAVEKQQSHYQVSQPLPRFDYSLERDVAIQLYKARNERVATHTVWRSDMGAVEGDCPSIGYPIPYDTSLTNPLQGTRVSANGGVTSIEQAEPNGLFASKNSVATWVRCVSEVKGEPVEAPVYIESKVTAYPYPVEIDYEINRVKPVQDAAPSVKIESKK